MRGGEKGEVLMGCENQGEMTRVPLYHERNNIMMCVFKRVL